jgi:hypothetical protein
MYVIHPPYSSRGKFPFAHAPGGVYSSEQRTERREHRAEGSEQRKEKREKRAESREERKQKKSSVSTLQIHLVEIFLSRMLRGACIASQPSLSWAPRTFKSL